MRATLCALPILRDRGDLSVLRDLLGLDRLVQIKDKELRIRARIARFTDALDSHLHCETVESAQKHLT